LLAGGGYYVASKSSTPVVTADPDHKAAEQKAEQERQELARLRAEAAAREKAEQEAALRRQAEEDGRRRLEAEAAAKRQAEDDARKAAEAAEAGLRLLPSDRQRVQVALTALGFDTGGADGVFNPRTREMIASWQRGKSYPATGFLSDVQQHSLLREAAPALAKYDDDRKKAAQPPQQAAVAPPAATVPERGVDGQWRGTYHCTPSRAGGDFTMHVQMTVAGGTGTWARPGSGPGTTGNQSLSIKIDGSQVTVSRLHTPGRQAGVFATGTMIARYENGTITGTGPEQNSGGRTCTINLTR
jgi:peptidoglycan hydrolase-like protein with peptidoglycan-binding domain